MSKYVSPITRDFPLSNRVFLDANRKILNYDDIARDLTEFYAMKARQEECDHSYNARFDNDKIVKEKYDSDFCPACGADLTKGANE